MSPTATDTLTEAESQKLDAIIFAENSHLLQWRKHLFALFLTILSLVVAFLRGSKNFPSIANIPRCGAIDWTLVVLLVILMGVFSWLAVWYNKKEYALKVKGGRGLVDSDIKYTAKTLFNLIFFAFVGGWVSGALGLGGGSIFNPLMISLGLPPSVSTSTGMYMITFSTAASSTIYITYGAMDAPFAVWLSMWSSLGILSGITVVSKLM